MVFQTLHAAVLVSMVALFPHGLSAQTFRAQLGDRTLGTVTYSSAGSGATATQRMITVLDNTPLGVGDGSFEAISQPIVEAGRRVRQYSAVSTSQRKSRTITVLHEAGRVLRTDVAPDSERTALSSPENVPAGIIDLAQAFGRFVHARTCPEPFRFYDGRRVIEAHTVESFANGPERNCKISYRVVAGPGHLSPLRLKSLTMDLVYDSSGTLHNGTVTAGLFSLTLTR